MELDLVARIVQQLTLGNIPSCMVGELALNYYNVPRAIHVSFRLSVCKQGLHAEDSQEIEICVPANCYSEALEVLQHKCRLLKVPDEVNEDMFTDYKKKFPRFAFEEGPDMQVTLLLDEVYGLQSLEFATVPKDGHHTGSYYSKEILDVLSPDIIALLPFPSLKAFMEGLCTRYIQSRDVVYAMAAEQLVDGMDIDDAWCAIHLALLPPYARQLYAISLRESEAAWMISPRIR